DRGVGIAVEVTGDELLVGGVEDPPQRTGRGFAEGLVDGLGRGRLLQFGHQIDHRHVGGGHAGGDAIELAFELGQDQAHRRGSAGGGGDHADGGRARPAQILVWEVVNGLIVRVRVDGGGETSLDAEPVVEHLGRGGQTVRGAGGVGADAVPGGVIGLLVHAEPDRHVRILGGGGDDPLLGARAEVLGGGRRVAEDSGGLHHHVYPEVLPGQGAGILDRAHADLAAI